MPRSFRTGAPRSFRNQARKRPGTRKIGAGRTIDEVLVDYPCLEREDILQAVQYAACLAKGRAVALTDAG
jgi:hypothetical protein